MSWDEHVMLIAHTVNSFGSHLQVIGNTGSNSTREALHATEQGFAVGMDAALQINPYYGKTSLDGLIAHFSAVLDEGPTIVYNVPSRTGIHAHALRHIYLKCHHACFFTLFMQAYTSCTCISGLSENLYAPLSCQSFSCCTNQPTSTKNGQCATTTVGALTRSNAFLQARMCPIM